MKSDRLRKLWTKLGEMPPKAALLWCLALTAAIELLTVFLRFCLGLTAQEDSAWLAPLTFGYRDHHGYFGVVLLIAGLFARRRPNLCRVFVIVGGALFLSDMIHHFLVLWPITGSPEFYVRYPE